MVFREKKRQRSIYEEGLFDRIGKGLFDAIVDEITNVGLDIDNIREQGYDNRSNMKGKHLGVQQRFFRY